MPFFAREAPLRATVAAVGILVAAAAVSRADEPNEYERLVAEKGPAYVTVKFVLKIKMGGFGDRENETEITGIMIEPEGLVLCSNMQIGGMPPAMRRRGNISAKPTDIKVLIGDDTEGLDATLIAKDSELDLAWVRIKEPGDKTFAHIDLAKSATAKVGQRLLAIRRMGKYFDRTMVVAEGRIGGITRKPRELYAPATAFAGDFGAPVFTMAGELVGITVMQFPDDEDGLTQRGAARGGQSGLILPAADVASATQLAKESEEEEG